MGVGLVVAWAVLIGVAAVVLLDRGDDSAATSQDQVPANAVEESESTRPPQPTTTTAAPTTTQPPETTSTELTEQETVPEPFTMWDALAESGEASQFAAIGGALGLQQFLEELEDENGNPVMRTLFAPSDAALETLGLEAIAAIAGDPDAANAFVGYHLLDTALTTTELAELDGQPIATLVGLPVTASSDESGNIVLNNTSVLTVTDLQANNGIVHVIDVTLQPPTIN